MTQTNRLRLLAFGMAAGFVALAPQPASADFLDFDGQGPLCSIFRISCPPPPPPPVAAPVAEPPPVAKPAHHARKPKPKPKSAAAPDKQPDK